MVSIKELPTLLPAYPHTCSHSHSEWDNTSVFVYAFVGVVLEFVKNKTNLILNQYLSNSSSFHLDLQYTAGDEKGNPTNNVKKRENNKQSILLCSLTYEIPDQQCPLHMLVYAYAHRIVRAYLYSLVVKHQITVFVWLQSKKDIKNGKGQFYSKFQKSAP